MRILLAIATILVLLAPPAAALQPAAHPFLWMDAGDVQAARKHWTDPWAREAFETSLSGGDTTTFRNLFRYQVLGDRAAGEVEKQKLLAFIGKRVEDSKPRDDNIEAVLRYDVLYDQLTPEQRAGVESTFRRHIDWLRREYWRGPADDLNWKGATPRSEYTRTNWLPNMHYPRAQGIFLMALALQDEALIRAVYTERIAGFRWFMGEYVADGHFYMEEFGKQYSTFGELLLWCRGCERLGLHELGFGHVGKNGATMRRYVDGLLMLTLPRVENPGGMPRFAQVTMGDAGPSVLVPGYDVAGKGDGRRWLASNMNGPVPRMLTPLWLEMAHATWPDGHYDYVLAQLRTPGQDRYYPSLFFGLDPIDPAHVTPPPAPSYVARERGFAMLRAEEGPAHWTSPKPAVALQFGMYYVHYVHDCFTLLDYYAYNRPFYTKRTSGPAMGGGYAGGHPWRDTVRGHNGVVVDNKQIQPVDSGDEGCAHQDIRQELAPGVKFVAVHAGSTDPAAKSLYSGVQAERALFLTDEFLCDIFRLTSGRPRRYDWSVHAAGGPWWPADETWMPTREFDGGKLWDLADPQWARYADGVYDMKQVRTRTPGDQGWAIHTVQPGGVGVVTRMLGEAGTTLYHDTADGLATIIARRDTPATCFAALHEPFAAEGPRIATFARIAQTETALAARVAGPDFDDRVLLAGWGAHRAPLTLADAEERFTFTDHAYVRVREGVVTVTGQLQAMRLRVGVPAVKLIVNGIAQPAAVTNGVLDWAEGR